MGLLKLFGRGGGGREGGGRRGGGRSGGGRSGGGPALVIDPCAYDPDAPRLRDMLERRDWASARDFLNGVTDPDDRMFYLSICSDVSGLQDWIEEWIEAEPGSTLPLLLRGVHGVFWAWEARGSARADDTSRDQFKEFHRRLKMAENCLDEVVERDPDEVGAWGFLVTSARGRQVDRDEAQRRFDNAVRCHPHNVWAHQQMLQYLCRKWFGSHEEMFAFARTAAESAPPGSRLGELVATAHIEQWLDMDNGAEREGYLARPEVAAELNAAADRSVRHPGFVRRPGWPNAHNAFAFAFAMADDNKSAVEQFEIIGHRVTEFPWCYHRNDPLQSFEVLREYVGAPPLTNA